MSEASQFRVDVFRQNANLFSMPQQHPWRDLIFPQVPASHLLEKYVVASPQGSATQRMRLSSAGVQVSNLLCLKVSLCMHS